MGDVLLFRIGKFKEIDQTDAEWCFIKVPSMFSLPHISILSGKWVVVCQKQHHSTLLWSRVGKQFQALSWGVHTMLPGTHSIPTHSLSNLKWVNGSMNIRIAPSHTANATSMEHHSASIWLISLRLPILERVTLSFWGAVYHVSPSCQVLSGTISKLVTPAKTVPLCPGPASGWEEFQHWCKVCIHTMIRWPAPPHFFPLCKLTEMNKWVKEH